MLRFLALALCLLMLSGCVWSRLLTLKGQFKEFDRYIEPVDAPQSLLLRFKEPCVQPGDWGYLLGDEIPTVRTAATATAPETWTWRLRRDRADSIGLEITIQVKDGMTTSLKVPPEVMRFVPKERMLAIVRAFGSADIDKGNRQASAGLVGEDNKPITPGRATIIAALGEPDASENVNSVERMTYRFQLQKPDGTLGETSILFVSMKAERLTALRLEAPRFKAEMSLDEAEKAK